MARSRTHIRASSPPIHQRPSAIGRTADRDRADAIERKEIAIEACTRSRHHNDPSYIPRRDSLLPLDARRSVRGLPIMPSVTGGRRTAHACTAYPRGLRSREMPVTAFDAVGGDTRTPTARDAITHRRAPRYAPVRSPAPLLGSRSTRPAGRCSLEIMDRDARRCAATGPSSSPTSKPAKGPTGGSLISS